MSQEYKNMRIKPETHKALKIVAVKEGKTFDEMIVESVKAFEALKQIRG